MRKFFQVLNSSPDNFPQKAEFPEGDPIFRELVHTRVSIGHFRIFPPAAKSIQCNFSCLNLFIYNFRFEKKMKNNTALSAKSAFSDEGPIFFVQILRLLENQN